MYWISRGLEATRDCFFGARSEIKPVWRISLHKHQLSHRGCHFFRPPGVEPTQCDSCRFLKTAYMPFDECLLLFALGAIPLLILETAKVAQHARRQRRTEG
jgi:Ca2+-transporting ATPase